MSAQGKPEPSSGRHLCRGVEVTHPVLFYVLSVLPGTALLDFHLQTGSEEAFSTNEP
jgi:hypothetical protein